MCFPGWTGGHNGTYIDTCSDAPLPSCGPTSNYWINSFEDAETPLCGGKFKVGDAVFANVANPSGSTNLYKGMVGQIYCGSSSSPPIGVNWGPVYTSGHDGNTGGCDASNLPLSSDASNWYVHCEEINALATEM